MSDSEDQSYSLPCITKSALRPTNPRAKAAKKSSIGITVLDNSNAARIPVVKATLIRDPAPDQRALGNPLIGGTNNSSKVKTAAKTPRVIGRNTCSGDQDLDQSPAARDPSRPDHLTGSSPSHESQVAPRAPKKVIFNVPDFPLPLERRPTTRNRAGQNAGRLNPGFVRPGALTSNPTSLLPERPSRTVDVQRRSHSTQSANNALDQHRRTAAKARLTPSHKHAESLPGKWARKFEITGSRLSSVPRMTSARKYDAKDDAADSSNEHDSGSAFYISAGLTLSNLRRDESSDSDSVQFSRDTRVGVKAARKLQFGRKSKPAPLERQSSITDSSTQPSDQSGDDGPAVPAAASEDSEELEYIDADISHLNVIRERTALPSEPDAAEAEGEADGAEGDEAPSKMPSDALIEALENISLGTIRLATLRRLPFMPRTLREGFLSRCKSLGIDTSHSLPPHKPIIVVYSCTMQVKEDTSPKRHVARTTMREWKCPLCELHGTFLSWQILSAHLQWDHSNVGFEWDMLDYTLMLRLPSPTLIPTFPHSRFTLAPSARTTPTKTPDLSNKIFGDKDLTTQPSSRYTSVSSQSFRDPSAFDTVKSEHYPSAPRASSMVSSNVRSNTVSSRAPSRASSIRTAGNPIPPPQTDIFGPAAQYPYLPESHSNGIYSCRIGGPRLYDLLNTMSLEPFGVLAWVVLDREEEIFEIDDVRDEDKVMQALWFRWIFLNRNKFVANFFNGTKSFIKENWQMIHQAAGLAALRTWLLVLNINNFLVALDVVTLLRFYRGLTGMQHWYDGKHAAQDEVTPV